VSKKDWLKSKEEFLSKQKQEVQELKAKLVTLTDQLAAVKEDRRKRDEEKSKAVKTPAQVSDDLTRGCIVCIEVKAAEEGSSAVFKLSRQQFKDRHLATCGADQVAYVDLDKHSNRIYVRCSSPKAAATLMADTEFGKLLPVHHKTLLSSVVEEAYFAKIAEQRSRKQDKKERKQQKSTVALQPPVVDLSKKTPVIKQQQSPPARQLKNSAAVISTTKHIKFDDE
jgi:hypothetical protein